MGEWWLWPAIALSVCMLAWDVLRHRREVREARAVMKRWDNYVAETQLRWSADDATRSMGVARWAWDADGREVE